MPTQEQKDRAFLKGFIQTTIDQAHMKAQGLPNHSQTAGEYAEHLVGRGFHRGSVVTDIDINRFAQYLYEEGGTTVEAMTDKPKLVHTIHRALARAGVAITEEVE